MEVSLPIMKRTWIWLYRASTTKFMIGGLAFAALLPSPIPLQGATVMLPLMMGSQGVSSGIRQDCLELLFCRPVSKTCFVLSKWLAYFAAVSLILTLHIPILFLVGESFLSVATQMIGLLLISCIATAAGALNRVLIVDPRRQGICLTLSLLFGPLFGVDIETKHIPFLYQLKHILCPTSFHTVAGQVGCSLGITEIFLSILNTAILLVIACILMNRQQLSYSFDA